MTNIEFLRQLSEVKDTTDFVFPDQWNAVCQKRGINVSQAQQLYAILKAIGQGLNGIYSLAYRVSNEQAELMLDIAKEARQRYNKIRHTILNVKGLPYQSDHIIVYWKDENGVIQSQERLIKDSETYHFVAEMMQKEYEILAIIQQCDEIYNPRDYYGPRHDGKKVGSELYVYEGDVFCVFNKTNDGCFGNSSDCGLYMATKDGCYRRLIYTPGKGYLRKSEPDVDDEAETIEFGNRKFNDYVLHLSNRFCWVGNVYVDKEFLKENSHADSSKR